jgi:hypothetical protein
LKYLIRTLGGIIIGLKVAILSFLIIIIIAFTYSIMEYGYFILIPLYSFLLYLFILSFFEFDKFIIQKMLMYTPTKDKIKKYKRFKLNELEKQEIDIWIKNQLS